MKTYLILKTKWRRKFSAFGRTSKGQAGFSLIEILIALSVFATFITAFFFGQGTNLLDSSRMKKEKILSDLCELKINKILANPPTFSTSLTLSKDTGNFSDDGFPEYIFEIEYKEMKLPDLTKLNSSGDSEEDESKADATDKKIFAIIKRNLETLIWQVKVTVKEKDSDYNYSLTSWVMNSEAKVNINL